MIEVETSLANTKLQTNTFESRVSSQMDILTRKLESVASINKKDDTEVLKLREDNERLRRRVQQLEDTIASLQSTSTAAKKEMDAMKLSQDVLKVKITNVKEPLVTVRNSAQRKTDVQRNDESVANQSADPVLEYSLPTRNRFEALLYI
ncbi:hypothetical protein Bbelb_079650 [Branchiostoma belcheri]|nr:hypothetical protein Bbelb_079650 [Branchiostoma belcheri]